MGSVAIDANGAAGAAAAVTSSAREDSELRLVVALTEHPTHLEIRTDATMALLLIAMTAMIVVGMALYVVQLMLKRRLP